MRFSFKAAESRGLIDHPLTQRWEALDRESILPPVAYASQHIPRELILPMLADGALLPRGGVPASG